MKTFGASKEFILDQDLEWEEVGESVKRKLTVHKLANANRAFAHYRWF